MPEFYKGQRLMVFFHMEWVSATYQAKAIPRITGSCRVRHRVKITSDQKDAYITTKRLRTVEAHARLLLARQ